MARGCFSQPGSQGGRPLGIPGRDSPRPCGPASPAEPSEPQFWASEVLPSRTIVAPAGEQKLSGAPRSGSGRSAHRPLGGAPSRPTASAEVGVLRAGAAPGVPAPPARPPGGGRRRRQRAGWGRIGAALGVLQGAKINPAKDQVSRPK